jgi:hypothetical protein
MDENVPQISMTCAGNPQALMCDGHLGHYARMFIGHFAVALAAKPVARRVPLAVLLVASQVPDVLWPVLVVLGIERAHVEPGAMAASPLVLEYMPYSHSLVAVVLAALVCGGLYAAAARIPAPGAADDGGRDGGRGGRVGAGTSIDRRGGAVIGAAVVSHWVLDWVTHAPDMPLFAGDGPLLGAGLWNSLPATLIVEIGMFAIGAALYAGVTRAKDRVGSVAWWALVALLVALELGALLGPPPPSIDTVLGGAAGVVLIIPWAIWIERHRSVVPERA